MIRLLKLLVLMSLMCANTVLANNLPNEWETNLTFANEYNKDNEFDLNKIPNCFFYKLNSNSKYYVYDENDILAIYQNDKGGIAINYNKQLVDLTHDNGSFYTSKDTSIYIIKDENTFYLFVDKMHFNDNKSYNLYKLTEKGIDLIFSERGLIDFVGYDYIIGYKYFGIIGYQNCEFKKIFKNGILELDGNYKVVGSSIEQFPMWKYYTLTKDLNCSEYDDILKKSKDKVVKKGTKVRTLSTDGKTYIILQIKDDNKVTVRVDKVDEENDNNFIVNGNLFMDYYFLDGSKRYTDVYCSMPAY